MRTEHREKGVEFLDHPTTQVGKAYQVFSLVLIFASVFQVVLAAKNPELIGQHQTLFVSVEKVILLFFTVDLLLRVILYRKKFKYLFSFYGLVDVIAVVPGVIGLFFPLANSTSWVRILRIFRVGRVLRTMGGDGIFGGFNGQLMPYIAGAIGFKSLVLVLEEYQWWPKIENLGVILGVVGFALAVLLGTKLRLVNSRMYSIEDAVCRIVGALRLMRHIGNIRTAVNEWAESFEGTIHNPTKADVSNMRVATDDLAFKLEAESVGGPNIAGFTRDVSYVLHRVTAHSPVAYERFLKYVTFTYTATVVFVVPGLTGFLASVLVVYTLLGMYLLIDDMDRPLEYSENSFIAADLGPLTVFNEKRTT